MEKILQNHQEKKKPASLRSRKQSLVQLKDGLCRRLHRRRSILTDPNSPGLSSLLRNINTQIAATSNFSVNELEDGAAVGRQVRSSSVPPFAIHDTLEASYNQTDDGDDSGSGSSSSSSSEEDEDEDDMLLAFMNNQHASPRDSTSSLYGKC
ncbi:uncharacterized protein LOC126981326 [Eriocheir sinensis]|uniref:uncharacterized protein LOC126981326 n=1 Tax=Eriocheir sinensis TaxID=95602 RepID=UPI0021CA7B96|nr:uncharacterized protein LOC126981326 [Eriocheir sinensis]XP_050688278.1 uncharacterized protein LOC126981326 [Eriocheir sinensis]